MFAGKLSQEEIARMIREAETYRLKDQIEVRRLQAKNNLESFAFKMRRTAKDAFRDGELSSDDRDEIVDECEEVLDWMKQNEVSVV